MLLEAGGDRLRDSARHVLVSQHAGVAVRGESAAHRGGPCLMHRKRSLERYRECSVHPKLHPVKSVAALQTTKLAIGSQREVDPIRSALLVYPAQLAAAMLVTVE